MAKLTLYHAAPSRSSITRWMLEEVGEPYDVQLLSLSKGDNRVTIEQQVEAPGFHRLDATVQSSSDTSTENNSASAIVATVSPIAPCAT